MRKYCHKVVLMFNYMYLGPQYITLLGQQMKSAFGSTKWTSKCGLHFVENSLFEGRVPLGISFKNSMNKSYF